MAFEDFKSKTAVTVVYTGEGKGKSSASLGLVARALGSNMRVAFIQFIKYWDVGEHQFLKDVAQVYGDNIYFFKGGKGFFKAGEISAKGVTEEQHKQAADETYQEALKHASSGDYDVVVCDEINNAFHDGLLSLEQLKELLEARHENSSLCLTGRNFPKELLEEVDIATNMTKLKHHFDDKFIANKGIDY